MQPEQPSAPNTTSGAPVPTLSRVPTPAPESTIPRTWPGGFGAFKYAKEATLTNWKTYLGLMIFTTIFFVFMEFISGSSKDSPGLGFAMYFILTYVISLLIGVASVVIELHNAQKKEIDISAALAKAPQHFLSFLVLAILMSIVLGISILLLFVPFLFVLPRVMLAPYFLIDQDLGPVEALQASWKKTEGHATKVWGTLLASFVYGLLFYTIIGIPVAAYLLFMYSSVSAVLYYFIIRESAGQTQPSTSTPAATAPSANVNTSQPSGPAA